MTPKPPLPEFTGIHQTLASRRYGVVASIRSVYDDCVEPKLPENLQRLLERLDRANA